MNLGEARKVQEGDYVASRYDQPEWIVRRVTETWARLGSDILRFRLASYAGRSQVAGGWVSFERFERVPKWRQVPETSRPKGVPYKQGDILAPEHRPSQNVENAPEAISRVDNGGGATTG